MSSTIHGQHITIYQLNDYYSHVSAMLLEHFDNVDNNAVFVIGNYIYDTQDKIQKKFPNRKIIAYQLEQLMGGTDNWHPTLRTIHNLKTYDEIWDYDKLNAAYLEYNNIKVKRILPLRYTKSLKKIQNNPNPKIDVLFYGMINKRRFKILDTLQQKLYNKLKFVWVYGEKDMDSYIADSKVILNIHAFEPWNRQEQVRMFYPIINSKTVVSEISQKNYLKDLIIESNIDNLADTLMSCCGTNIWKSFGHLAAINFENSNNI